MSPELEQQIKLVGWAALAAGCVVFTWEAGRKAGCPAPVRAALIVLAIGAGWISGQHVQLPWEQQ
jgi:hypothetical protein